MGQEARSENRSEYRHTDSDLLMHEMYAPIVGMVCTYSPNLNLYKMVDLPSKENGRKESVELRTTTFELQKQPQLFCRRLLVPAESKPIIRMRTGVLEANNLLIPLPMLWIATGLPEGGPSICERRRFGSRETTLAISLFDMNCRLLVLQSAQQPWL